MTDIRKLVTIRKIDRIDEIPNADAIVAAVIGGWKVVIKRGDFQAGDTVLFFEVDAALPTSVPEFEFLAARSERAVLNPDNIEVKVHVLRTAKLRGQISQGLVLPLGFGLAADSTQEEINTVFSKLGVFKYEPALPIGGAMAVGAFPSLVRKTDSERVQNITDEFLRGLDPNSWVATEKIDGTSSTFWKLDGVLHAAGRNWELSLDGTSHAHAQIAAKYRLDEVIPEGGFIQGEIYGEGIQKNPLKIQGVRLAVFSTGFITDQADSVERSNFMDWVQENQAPRVELPFPKTVEEAVAQVDGMKSLVNPQALAEGVVWWNIEGEAFSELGDRANFKSISAKFLLKLKD